ncbi:modifier of mdg4-like [Aricia agestis]|uniref:modifier of mdg4-like n=1 Tax=Aricia agestis TaxID=91739 RepID=UPI001C2040BC|nr:modifier of mdg4-like [Aricia agestis]
MAQLSVSWSNHLNNIGQGLSALQQNSEFVDMTLAADGHFVKVHQLVMAISSPYIKNLIAAAACPHPVIYLNKISQSTLCSILEYIYTGEVTVAIENLRNILETAKDLHIKGLEDMDIAQLLSEKSEHIQNQDKPKNFYQEPKKMESVNYSQNMELSDVDATDAPQPLIVSVTSEAENITEEVPKKAQLYHNLGKTPLQYTVSNRGSIQLIFNRFVYYLKHTNKDRTRQWRCVEYVNHHKCPALIVTKDEVVTKRISAHSHPFHDKRILKKVRSGTVFSTLNEAESTVSSEKVMNKTCE